MALSSTFCSCRSAGVRRKASARPEIRKILFRLVSDRSAGVRKMHPCLRVRYVQWHHESVWHRICLLLRTDWFSGSQRMRIRHRRHLRQRTFWHCQSFLARDPDLPRSSPSLRKEAGSRLRRSRFPWFCCSCQCLWIFLYNQCSNRPMSLPVRWNIFLCQCICSAYCRVCHGCGVETSLIGGLKNVRTYKYNSSFVSCQICRVLACIWGFPLDGRLWTRYKSSRNSGSDKPVPCVVVTHRNLTLY